MFRYYEYRIYPSKDQQVLIQKHFGCARLIYNKVLESNIKSYSEGGKTPSKFDRINEVTAWKSTEELSFLKEVHSACLNNAVTDLYTAYTNFFRNKKGFPKFKSKHNNRKTYRVHQTGLSAKFDYEKNKIWLPKLKWLDCRLERECIGKVKSVTVKQVPSGKYFVSVLVDNGEEFPPKKPITRETTIGIDLGIKTFVTASNGLQIPNIKPYKSLEKLLKKRSREHSRKVKGSRNREKARIKLARVHERIANIRKDYINKTVHKLLNDNQIDTICVETLNVQGMLKNHRLAKAISDVSMYEFKQRLEWKANLLGKNILYIGQFEPSSKLCSKCGYINKELTMSDREWTCPQCNTHHDRDINASVNIKEIALRDYFNKTYTGLGKSVELGELLTVVRAKNQESSLF